MPSIGRRWRKTGWGHRAAAVWLAVVLALAPLADRPAYAGSSLAVQDPAAQLDALVPLRDPVAAARLGKTAVPGLLVRLLSAESKLAPATGKWPVKALEESPPARAADAAPASIRPAVAPLRRSAHPVAHPPTGPPA